LFNDLRIKRRKREKETERERKRERKREKERERDPCHFKKYSLFVLVFERKKKRE